FVHSDADEGARSAVLGGCQAIRLVSHPQAAPTAPAFIGVDAAVPSGNLPEEGASKAPNPVVNINAAPIDGASPAPVMSFSIIPGVIVTVAVGATIGLVHYFNTEAKKEKYRYDAQTAQRLAAVQAALAAALERYRLQAQTGQKIDPSPVELA